LFLWHELVERKAWLYKTDLTPETQIWNIFGKNNLFVGAGEAHFLEGKNFTQHFMVVIIIMNFLKIK
jgi:hypothetical protein